MHCPKGEGRRLVDSNLRGGAQDSSRRNTAGSRARHGASHREGDSGNDALREICYRRKGQADELAKDGAMMDGSEMAQIRASTVHQKGQEVSAALQYAASFY